MSFFNLGFKVVNNYILLFSLLYILESCNWEINASLTERGMGEPKMANGSPKMAAPG